MATALPLTNQNRQLGAAYPVTLPAFQGPLDLLLRLIEKNELAISTISLVAVTEQYLRTVEQMQQVTPDALADFLVIASRLLYIKSYYLLPKPRPPAEEEEEEDAGDALVRQLLEYRQFKEVAASLRTRETLGLRSYIRVAPPLVTEKRLEPGAVDASQLQAILRRVLARVAEVPQLPTVKSYPVTVAEKMAEVRGLLRRASAAGTGTPLRFAELLGCQSSRMEVIVTFLAVLELIKQQELQAVQDDLFGEIVLEVMANSSVLHIE